MDKKLKIINFVLILAVLSSLAYAATEEEFNKDFQQQIAAAPTDDNGLALSDLQFQLIDIAKSKNFKIYPETKYVFYKKHIAVTDTDKVLYLTVVRKDMKLTKDELSSLSPAQQAEVATVIKKGGGGFSLGGTASVLVLFILIAAYLWFRYAHKHYMLGRQAKKILQFEKHAQSSLRREELNMGTIGDIEKKKQVLIEKNMMLAKNLETDEHERLRLDHELRSKTEFKDGIYDKRLAKVPNIEEFLNKSRISKQDAGAIEAMVKGTTKAAAHRLRDNIVKIKEQNSRIQRLIEKEIVLDNKMMEELLRGKEQLDISNVDLEKLREFVKGAER
jgi:hypothetical protein